MYRLLRALVLIANGLAVVLFLFAGLISQVSDVGTNEALEWLLWSLALAAAALIVICFVLRPATRRKTLVVLPYGATIFVGVVAGLLWSHHFNLFSAICPPIEAIVLGSLSIIDLAAIAATNPISLRSLIPARSFRWAVSSAIALAIAVAGVAAYGFIDRIASQYPYAERILARGGGLYWVDGWVTGIRAHATKISDDDLVDARQFPKLQSLDLSDTKISDVGLAHISGIQSLDHLDLDKTQITDRGLRHLTRLTRLRNLSLRGTQVTNDGLANLEPMTQMGYLELGRTKVTDAGLIHLRGMTQLYYFGATDTGVSDDGLRQFAHSIPGLSAWNGRVHISR